MELWGEPPPPADTPLPTGREDLRRRFLRGSLVPAPSAVVARVLRMQGALLRLARWSRYDLSFAVAVYSACVATWDAECQASLARTVGYVRRTAHHAATLRAELKQAHAELSAFRRWADSM